MAMAAAVFDRAVAHDRNRLPSKNELADVYVDSIHPGKNNIISLSRIDDQELSIAPVGTGEGNPSITGRGDNASARVAIKSPFSVPPNPSGAAKAS